MTAPPMHHVGIQSRNYHVLYAYANPSSQVSVELLRLSNSPNLLQTSRLRLAYICACASSLFSEANTLLFAFQLAHKMYGFITSFNRSHGYHVSEVGLADRLAIRYPSFS